MVAQRTSKHLLEGKGSSRTRRLAGDRAGAGPEAKRIRRLLGA